MTHERYALRFHHLGLAVRTPDHALHFLRGLGYIPGPPVFDPLQQVNLIFCPRTETGSSANAQPAVELIYAEPGVASPIDRIFAKGDELIYHVCYESPNPTESVSAMTRDGNRVVCVSPAKPAVLFDQREVSFWYVRGFGVIEILATEPQ